MYVVIIQHKTTHNVVAVIEAPENMSEENIALAWAKANGYQKIPTDVNVSGKIPLKPMASVLFNLIPCHLAEEIISGKYAA